VAAPPAPATAAVMSGRLRRRPRRIRGRHHRRQRRRAEVRREIVGTRVEHR